MYGVSKYGTSKYGVNNILDDEIMKYKVDLKKYVPKFLVDVKEFNTLYNTQEIEIGRACYLVDDLLKQFFIDSATWGIILWEHEYGIETDLSKSYEERREIIRAKKRGQGTTTKEMIQRTAESFSGGEVKVIEHNSEGYFVVQFVGIKGIPRNLASFKEMLERIKPAHLDYEFKFTYTVWNFLNEKKLTWDGANTKTWDDLKVFEEVV